MPHFSLISLAKPAYGFFCENLQRFHALRGIERQRRVCNGRDKTSKSTDLSRPVTLAIQAK